MSGYSQTMYCLQEKSTHFGLEVSVIYVISRLYVLNCFKYFLIYILGRNVSKLDKKNFELYQVFMCYNVLNIF